MHCIIAKMDDPFVFPDNGYKNMRDKLKQYKIIIAITFVSFIVALILFICSILLGFGCHSDTKTHRGGSSPVAVLKFFHVSDIHLDLYYNSSTSRKSFCRSIPNTLNITPVAAPFDAPYGRVECDSPKMLLNSALGFMKNLSSQQGNDIDFILLTGKNNFA